MILAFIRVGACAGGLMIPTNSAAIVLIRRLQMTPTPVTVSILSVQDSTLRKTFAPTLSDTTALDARNI